MERRNFDREFREGAVRIVRETGKPIAQVARELGLNEGTLGRWVNLDRRAREGEGSLNENERDELNRLRKENAELAMERLRTSRSIRRSGHLGAQPLQLGDVPSRKPLHSFMFPAIPGNPVGQSARIDPQVPSDLVNRLTGLPDNPDRPLPELRIEPSPCF
jgi:transposase